MDIYKKPKPTAAVLNATPTHAPENGGGNVSIAPLITMIFVLAIILIFCFCGSPGVREFCRKKVCYCCPEPEDEAGTPIERAGSSTPTIILLPFGRMLVVDRSVFAHFQADETGLDFMELSANLIRAHRLQYEYGHGGGGGGGGGTLAASTPSILDGDSEATSKGISPSSLGYSPPAYEDIVKCDLPPSYSELSLLLRQQYLPQSTGTATAAPLAVASSSSSAHTTTTTTMTPSRRLHLNLNHANQRARRLRHHQRVDNCCVQVTASLNDVVDVGDVHFTSRGRLANLLQHHHPYHHLHHHHQRYSNNNKHRNGNNNNEHITTSVLHIVDERQLQRAATAEEECVSVRSPAPAPASTSSTPRTESDTNIHRKYRILSKQSSF